METIDFGIKTKNLWGIGLKGSLEDFSSDELHTHPFHQVLQISRGVALLEEERVTKPQYGFLAAFIPADAPHRTRVLGDAVEYQSLYFSASLARNLPKSIVIFRMSELGRSLLNRMNAGEPLRNLNRGMDKDYLLLFVKVLKRDLRDNKARLLELPAPAVAENRQACAYIERHYDERIKAGHFSAVVPLSFRQLSRGFRSEMSITVFEYLRLYRMLRASVLLQTTDRKILDVAYRCGYGSVSTFFTDFRRIFGCSPVQFRNLQPSSRSGP